MFTPYRFSVGVIANVCYRQAGEGEMTGKNIKWQMCRLPRGRDAHAILNGLSNSHRHSCSRRTAPQTGEIGRKHIYERTEWISTRNKTCENILQNSYGNCHGYAKQHKCCKRARHLYETATSFTTPSIEPSYRAIATTCRTCLMTMRL